MRHAVEAKDPQAIRAALFTNFLCAARLRTRLFTICGARIATTAAYSAARIAVHVAADEVEVPVEGENAKRCHFPARGGSPRVRVGEQKGAARFQGMPHLRDRGGQRGRGRGAVHQGQQRVGGVELVGEARECPKQLRRARVGRVLQKRYARHPQKRRLVVGEGDRRGKGASRIDLVAPLGGSDARRAPFTIRARRVGRTCRAHSVRRFRRIRSSRGTRSARLDVGGDIEAVAGEFFDVATHTTLDAFHIDAVGRVVAGQVAQYVVGACTARTLQQVEKKCEPARQIAGNLFHRAISSVHRIMQVFHTFSECAKAGKTLQRT